MHPTLDLASELIRRPSLTPEDAGCQALIAARLEPLGFRCEWFSHEGVTNLWARRGTAAPLLCLAGHTDVVPTGPREAWDSDPFEPTIRAGQLYGRGAADMKGGLAALITAAEAFVQAHPDHAGSLAFLITSDEEGSAIHGTAWVVQQLEARGEKIDYCLLGEPTGEARLGDCIKNGRRGSLTGFLKVLGKQGHVAYPHLAKNPFHACAATLADLVEEVWDEGNEFFPPTSFQIANLHMGTGADNVIPGSLSAQFNLRFSTELNEEKIQARVAEILDRGNFDYELRWQLSGLPFLTAEGVLIEATKAAVEEVLGQAPKLSTGGGTSDGRFIAPTGAQVLELGARNATIHQVNECVGLEELEQLFQVYRRILEKLLPDQP